MDARLNELEIKLSYLEDLVETLNQTVIRQERLIDLLQSQFRLLHQQMQADADSGAGVRGDLREDIPPHY